MFQAAPQSPDLPGSSVESRVILTSHCRFYKAFRHVVWLRRVLIAGMPFALPALEIAKGDIAMLNWALTFLVVALIAGVLGFGGIAGTAVGIAKIIFLVFLIAFVVSLFVGRRNSIP